MISKKLQDAINKQINAELYSAYLYLSMAAYFQEENLSGFANWMQIQFQEEQFHAMKLFNYLTERGGRVILQTIEAPKSDFDGVIAVFTETLEHERHVTKLLNELADVADEVRDRPTQNLVGWYVDEQVEEENTAESILNSLKLINGEGHGMLMLDREFATRVFTPPTNA